MVKKPEPKLPPHLMPKPAPPPAPKSPKAPVDPRTPGEKLNNEIGYA